MTFADRATEDHKVREFVKIVNGVEV
jgi:hypothetical protein